VCTKVASDGTAFDDGSTACRFCAKRHIYIVEPDVTGNSPRQLVQRGVDAYRRNRWFWGTLAISAVGNQGNGEPDPVVG
jgi:hypothetical protein